MDGDDLFDRCCGCLFWRRRDDRNWIRYRDTPEGRRYYESQLRKHSSAQPNTVERTLSVDLSGVREIPEEESPLNATPALSTTSRVAIQKPTAALPNSSGVDIEVLNNLHQSYLLLQETEQVISSYLPPTVVEIAQEPLLKESESWWLDVGLPDGDVRLSTHLVLEDRQIAYDF